MFENGRKFWIKFFSLPFTSDVDVSSPDEKSIMTYVAQFLQYSSDMPAPDDHLQVSDEITFLIFSAHPAVFWSSTRTFMNVRMVNHLSVLLLSILFFMVWSGGGAIAVSFGPALLLLTWDSACTLYSSNCCLTSTRGTQWILYHSVTFVMEVFLFSIK